MEKEWRSRTRNRLMLYLNLPVEKEKERDFYEHSRHIFLGTYLPFDDLMRNTEDEWYGVEIPPEFRWILWSQSGYLKTTMLKIMLPYFYMQGYHICIIEAKDDTLSTTLGIEPDVDKLYPKAYPIALPVVSHIPSYLYSTKKEPADRIDPRTIKKFTRKVTLDVKGIKHANEWQALLGASQGGADILVAANSRYHGNLDVMKDQISKGWVKDIDGRIIKLHATARESVRIKLNRFITDEVFNAPGCEQIDLESIWAENKIASFSFFNSNPDYIRMYVMKLLQQARHVARAIEQRNRKPEKFCMIFDDCQIYLNTKSDDNNIANEAVRNSMRMDRSVGINSIFTVQSMVDFNPAIYSERTDMFIGMVTEFGGITIPPEHKNVIVQNRSLLREENLPSGYKKKTVAYYHLPLNHRGVVFYPNDPNCGGW